MKEDSYYEELIPKLYKPVPKIGPSIMLATDQELPFVVEPAPEPEPAVEPEPLVSKIDDNKPSALDKLIAWLNSFGE